MGTTTGLEHRYDVRRVGDTKGKHDDCRYFVLDPQHDDLARVALRRYATEARYAGLQALARDLDAWLDDLASRRQ